MRRINKYGTQGDGPFVFQRRRTQKDRPLVFQKDRPLVFLLCSYICCGLVISLLAGCQTKKEEKADHKVRVESRTVERGLLEISSDYIGSLSPNISISVVPFVSANVEEVYVKVGDRVKSGQVLCQLDDRSADLSVQSAEDAVDTAKAGKDAAEVQADSSKIQADSSVKTLKKTLKSYKDALKTARKQKKKLKNSKKSLGEARSSALTALQNSNKRYKTAENLLIQFESFLNNNPDCKTTSGLMAAASNLSTDPADYVPDLSDTDGSQDTQTGSEDSGMTGNTGSDGNSETEQDTGSAGSGSSPSSGDQAKQQQAQALLNALNQAGLTVEYLSTTGLNSLKENASEAETAYTNSVSSASQIDTAIATLDTNITQLKTQISATQDSLDQARKLAELADTGTDVYDAQIKAAETGVEAAQYQRDMYRLTSPIDGIVEDVTVKKDNMAAQGVAAFTIVEKESMVATFYVTEEVSRFLKIGDPVDVVTDENQEDEENAGMAAGRITMIGMSADAQKGLFKVEAEILSIGRIHLAGGTSVRLSLVSNAVDNQLMIPYDSVYYDNGQAYVYRIIDDKAVRTDITTGIFNQEDIVVTEGLQEGDSIVTTWASGLKDGAQVEVAQ